MNTSILKLLLFNDVKVHIDFIDDSDQTSLHLAVRDDYLKMIKYFFKKSASLNNTDFTEISILQSALEDKNREMIFLLYARVKSSLMSLFASD